jgi:hypothetical protein
MSVLATSDPVAWAQPRAPRAASGADALREYLNGDYLMLFAAVKDESAVFLLSIRLHRLLSFDPAWL